MSSSANHVLSGLSGSLKVPTSVHLYIILSFNEWCALGLKINMHFNIHFRFLL